MIWGLVSALASTLQTELSLSHTQTALIVATPVVLGSLGRIPIGALADRVGGRAMFTFVLLLTALVSFSVPFFASWPIILVAAFLLGLPGASFPVGIKHVSSWIAPEKQGKAIGIYSMGNIGQSVGLVLAPVAASVYGWQTIFYAGAVLAVVAAATFGIVGREAQHPSGDLAEHQQASPFKQKSAWLLSMFYFLTFGGFVSFAIYLPKLLIDQFALSEIDAGARAAGFVILATLIRPVGGWLADNIGGAKVLSGVFIGIALFAPLLAWPSMLPFTVAALGCAALLGLGNGAVFKLVPEIFPRQVGAVSGLVGACGGFGGFFPPILLAASKQYLGVIWPCFAMLSALSILCWFINNRQFVARQEEREITLPPSLTRAPDQVKAGFVATLVTSVLLAAIVIGSRNLQNFDPALVIYTFATIFATWGVTYHYQVWLQKPPTRRYWKRGWQLFFSEGPRGILKLTQTAITHIFAQTFIARRSKARWLTHQFLFWGCNLAAAVTFPLVFGWIHFGTLPDDPMQYVPYVFGFPTVPFHVHSIVAWLTFHVLDFAAVFVIIGVVLSLTRRMSDAGAQALQSFTMDFVPLIMLFAISVTGLALTVSNMWFGGIYYDFLSIIHAVTVVAALLYLPFGKFFHIFQRPAQLGVKLYQSVGAADAGAHCIRCGERFASRMQIDDLNHVLPQLGFDYSMPGPAKTWQEICPPCKRKSLATAQLRIKEHSNG
jgi:MFS transporter, NNP family, nitrate/nitrite transporter